ncbi:MAG: M48 family metalloprotease [Actinomycetota bacterium]|nr:M48 family metalloprotease [Actinomycetota bacterium]
MSKGAETARARVQHVVRDLLPGEPNVEVVWAPGGHGGSSSTRAGHPVITISAPLLTQVEVALFVAAHEAGHIRLGHVAGRARTVGIYLGGFAGCLIAGCAIAVAAFGWAGINLAPLAMLVWVLAQRPLLARLKQPQELAADYFAARAGYPLTESMLTVLDVPVSRTDTWAGWTFPTHPTWATRLAVSIDAIPIDAIPIDAVSIDAWEGYQRHS